MRRIILVVVLLVVVVGAVVAFVLVGNQNPTPATVTDEDGNTVVQAPTRVSNATPIPTPTPISIVQMVVAIQDIPRGVEIAPDAVAVVPFAEIDGGSSIPFGSFVTGGDDPESEEEIARVLGQVIGQIARTDIYREQPILQNMLVEDVLALASRGSDAAAILQPNRVAIALPIDRITSVAYALQPGDRVDVIVSLLFVDVDQNFQSKEPNSFSLYTAGATGDDETVPIEISPPISGTFDTRALPDGRILSVIVSPSEEPRPRLATQRTIQDAEVIWLGDFPEDGILFRPAPTPTFTPNPEEEEEEDPDAPPATPTVPPRPDIITLAVSPQDAVVLTWLAEAGIPVTFALRSATGTSLVQTEDVTLDYILNRFNISVPEKFSYNIEPAIRSIRQLSVGNRIELRNQ